MPRRPWPLARDMSGNIAAYRWFRTLRCLLFWQATWFLFFQGELSAADAILLFAIYDIATTLLEVPSGYMSDRLGRRITLLASGVAALGGALLIGLGAGLPAFAAGQALLGISAAFASGTEESVLYESLAASGREAEIERQELVGWRLAFAAFAVSAVAGGAMALVSPRLPFLASALAGAGMIAAALRLSEPPPASTPAPETGTLRRENLRAALRHPVLRWLFALSVLMYAFSHLPFTFGQPFIAEALAHHGLAAEAPLVSGAVTAAMMGVSLLASLAAPGLRARFGIGRTFLLAFGLQIAVIAVLAATASALAIAVLLLRMVPDALVRPFLVARIQPLLPGRAQATYLSLQSLAGRIALALSLVAASGLADRTGAMSHAEIRAILFAYAVAGIAALALLAATARRVPLDGPR